MSMSQRLREPTFLVVLAIALAGWLAFFANWINASGQVSQLESQATVLTGERDTARDELAKREAASGSLADTQTQLTAKQEELGGVTTSLATAETDLAARNQELTELAANIEARRTELATLEAGVTETTATLSLAETQTQLQAAQDALTAAEEDLTALTARQEAAGAEVTTLEGEIATLTTERSALETEVADFEAQRATLQPQVTRLTTELQALETRIAATPTPAAETVFRVNGGAGTGMMLTLADDGSYRMTNAGRTVTGRYLRTDNQLVLTDGVGDTRGATFPMTCPTIDTGSGIRIGPAPGCVLAGLEFANQ